MATNSNTDLGLLLESDLLQLIRTQGIFLVLGLAFFHFTRRGKWFSIISLVIALILSITLLVNYYIDRRTAVMKGFKIKRLLDLLVGIMFFVAFFNIWIIYETLITPEDFNTEGLTVRNKVIIDTE